VRTQDTERRAALLRVGWARTGRADAWDVSRTVAATMAPGQGTRHRLLAAWCRPAAVAWALLAPAYHRSDLHGTVCTVLGGRTSPRRMFVVWIVTAPVVAVAIGLLQEVAYWPTLIVIAALLLYAVTVSACQSARDRAERTPAERRGRIRGALLTQSGWSLGRIRTSSTRPDGRAAAVQAVGDFLDAVVPAGEQVVAFARSDREQAELMTLGFTEPPGEHGPLVLVAPTARG
jgi:hypothetical protein